MKETTMQWGNVPVLMATLAGLAIFQGGMCHAPAGQDVAGFVVNGVLIALAARMLK